MQQVTCRRISPVSLLICPIKGGSVGNRHISLAFPVSGANVRSKVACVTFVFRKYFYTVYIRTYLSDTLNADVDLAIAYIYAVLGSIRNTSI